MVKALHVIDGIIQNKYIDGIPINIKIINPSGLKNVRTLVKMVEVIGITNHNTGNTNKSAGDEAHSKYLQSLENDDRVYKSVHLFVDHDSITQCVPLDEFCYHAGDGNGDGNRKTISIEICEGSQILLAESNAKKLNAALLLTYPELKIYKHQDWSGKYCPHIILDRKNGWSNFVTDIYNIVNERGKAEMEFEKVYNYLYDIPEWGKNTIEKLINNRFLIGGDSGELGITESMLRILVINDRAGCYGTNE